MEVQKRPRIIGNFIRQRREALSLSQRALGLLFEPAVTTQFISNVERGVTPLPPAHVPTLSKALLVSEEEILSLLEREYTAKLTGRMGKLNLSHLQAMAAGGSAVKLGDFAAALPSLAIANTDYHFMRSLYDAYRQADPKTRQAFATVCETILNLTKGEPAHSPNGATAAAAPTSAASSEG